MTISGAVQCRFPAWNRSCGSPVQPTKIWPDRGALQVTSQARSGCSSKWRARPEKWSSSFPYPEGERRRVWEASKKSLRRTGRGQNLCYAYRMNPRAWITPQHRRTLRAARIRIPEGFTRYRPDGGQDAQTYRPARLHNLQYSITVLHRAHY